jgi:DNA polymerase-3 subunit alpha
MKVDQRSWRENKGGVFLSREITRFCPSGDLQADGNELIMKIAKKTGMPLLLTLDSHFVKSEQKIVQDLALQNGKDEGVGLKFSTSYHMMPTESAWQNWKSIHGETKESAMAFEEAVENNQSLVDMCEKIDFEKEYHLPEVSIPVEILSKSSSRDVALKNYTISLIERYGRMKEGQEYYDRLKTELDVICNNDKINLLPYFITLHDVCAVARSIGVVSGIGRGSAGGSLLAYLLNVTHKDPIVYDMSFERFLSQGRISRGKFPDIDMDFSEPAKLAGSLKDIYTDRIVRICTTGTNQVRSAIKDVARVCLGTKEDKAMKEYIDSVCKTIALVPVGTADLNKWLDGYEEDSGPVQGELERNTVLRKFFEDHPESAKLVRSILGVPKSIGRHAAAYCIADQPIHQLVPICVVKGETCTQFTMDPIEKLGLIKFDILGLNTLKDISGALSLVKERHGLDLDFYNLPEDDQEVYKEFQKGKTETIFQFNGVIPTLICRKIKPKSIQDLAAVTAACRPGTMYADIEDDGKNIKLIDLWVERRAGRRRVTYLHPSLEPILRSTYGIFIFQEQINKMFVECCGYSPEEADEMREIIGKKKKEKMNELLPDIRDRLKNNGWSKTQIDSIMSLCIAASSYSFNFSHSISYACTAYACMWIKKKYPLEWWTAILQNSNHEDLKENAQHFSKYLMPPSINTSDIDFYIIDDTRKKIVYPLSMIKGVKNAAAEIVKHKPFTSFEDFWNRVEKRKVNKRVVMAMIWAGAFDEMPEAGEGAEWTKRNALNKKFKELRGEIPPEELSKGIILKLESASMCIAEPDIYQLFKQLYPSSQILPIDEIQKMRDKEPVSTIGIVTGIKTLQTKKGDDMCFVDLSNAEHKISITFFPKEYEAFKDFIKEDVILRVSGSTNIYNGKLSIVLKSATFYDLATL